MKRSTLSLLFIYCAIFTFAANVYVTPNGNDTLDGSSWEKPKATIQKAIAMAEQGDTVFISGGIYNQTIIIKDGVHIFGGYSLATGERDIDVYPTILDGTNLKSNLVIKSGSACKTPTYIDGLVLQNAHHTANGGAVALKANCVLNYCTIRNCYTDGSGGGVHNNSGIVQNCIIELCESLGAGGAVHNIAAGLVENTIIRGCKGNYAAIRNEGESIVRNCLLHNNEPSNSAWPNSGGIYNPSGIVYNCTMACNFGSQYAGFHSDNIAYNNLMWNNQSEEGFADPANFISGENIKFGSGNNAADYYFEAENFTVNLSTDNMASNGPHFVAPTNFVGAPKNAAEIAAMRAANFSITEGSAVIDKAKVETELTYDIENTQRPIGGRSDIGCYEYNPEAPIVAVTGVLLNMDTLIVYTTDTALMTAIILPTKATNRNLEWSIADTNIAKVENGAVVGLNVGETTVSVVTEDGKYKDTALVIVELKPLIIIHHEVLQADSLYSIEDYTIPSYIPFWMAKEAARDDSTEVNLQALRDKITLLQPYQMPYNVVANINGDPRTCMAFCWFTNEKMKEGLVELMPIAKGQKVKENEFVSTITMNAVSTITKPLNYATSLSGILKATKMPATQKFTYVSHKAIVDKLLPNTTYAYRVGVEGYWSEIGTFTTAPENDDAFTFIYMTDSHIMNQEYIDDVRLCAEKATEYTPDARFCVFPGDFVETGTNRNSEWEWERWFDEAVRPVIMQMPIVPTDGNHDDSSNQNYTYHFNTDNQFKENAKVKPQFDGTTYSFMYGDVLFLVYSLQDYWKGSYNLSTLTSTYLTNDVGNWFREQVAAHPEAKWRVALVHKNVFSGSGHQEDEETPLFRETMLPIFKDCEIDLVLQGHDHCYEIIGPVDADTRTPILNAISDVETVPMNMVSNMTGKKGGVFNVNDGTLYFIGATCGTKRYNPNHKLTMEADYEKHRVENYYDLFTGMFGQPGRPSYSSFTVDGNIITVNSYKVYEGMEPMLFNTFHIKRTREHTPYSEKAHKTLEQMIQEYGTVKILHNGHMLIVRENIAYDTLGQLIYDNRD